MTPTTAELGGSCTAAADDLIPAYHPFATHLRHVAERDAAAPLRPWTPEDGALPALYLSHGAPPTFEDGPWMRQLYDWARTLPKPKAILIVSAHWESDSLGITSTAPTELVYDFGGFHPMYYRMRYDTPDPAKLAEQLRNALPATEHVYEHRNRGLDHGAWVPLKVMYPEADIPVLQLSLPTSDTATHFTLGRHLRVLREQGVLVIGSGFMTHGLPYLDWSRPDQVPGWSAESMLGPPTLLPAAMSTNSSTSGHVPPACPTRTRPWNTSPRCSSLWAPLPIPRPASPPRSTGSPWAWPSAPSKLPEF
jgi:4,5-DOPA dioxygenase extradiol